MHQVHAPVQNKYDFVFRFREKFCEAFGNSLTALLTGGGFFYFLRSSFRLPISRHAQQNRLSTKYPLQIIGAEITTST